MAFTLDFTRRGGPDAVAYVKGSEAFRSIKGTVSFYQSRDGVIVVSDITGLPAGMGSCDWRVFGFHIHAGTSCSGTESDPFANADGHFNPNNCTHPHHAGDLPPLFGNKGKAYASVLTSRFKVNEVIGRTVIIHENPDDFNTQPSGNSGPMIACGPIWGKGVTTTGVGD